MLNISKERIDELVEKDSLDNALNKLVNFMAKAFVPVAAAELAAAFLLKPKLPLIASISAFAVIDVMLPAILSFSLIFIISFIKIKRVAGGMRGAIKVFREMHRSKKYYRMFRQELCSDAVMSEARAILEKTKKKEGFEYITALSKLALCHSMRCEFEQARSIVYEMKELPKTDHISRNDYMVAALDYSTDSGDESFFRETLAEYSQLLETSVERDASSASALLSIAAYEQKINGNYDMALEYLSWALKYREKNQKPGNYTNGRKISNLILYNNACLHLEKASCWKLKGDMQSAGDELRTAEAEISKLTCDIPPIFEYERKKI